jgi:uncharacterized lipoprotein YmbA
MKHLIQSLVRPFGASLCLVLLAGISGCNIVQPAQDDPTRYFVLSEPVAQAPIATSAIPTLRIGLKAVHLESYLKRREMVVRTGPNEVQFKDFRRWAEPLDAAVGRVLRTSLLGSGELGQVLAEPFPFDVQRDFDVSVEVRQCEGILNPSGRYGAAFSAMIEISTTGANPKVVARRLFVAPATGWDGSNYDQLAYLLTTDISALSQEILAALPPKT